MKKKTFTDGKSPETAPKEEPFDPEMTDPRSIAEVVLKHRADSVREDVKSHVALSKGANALLDDKEALEKFFAILMDRKVLSKDDVALAYSASESFLSMLNKIARYRDVITDDRIIGYLAAGYSVLYQLVSLYQDLEKYDGFDRPAST